MYLLFLLSTKMVIYANRKIQNRNKIKFQEGHI